MEYFKPAVFLDELYRNHYSINKSSDPGKSWYDPEHKETHDYIISNLHNIDTNDDIIRNEKKHYQLLRIIMFTICKYRSNKDYLNFIKELLMHLEELSISTEHEVRKGKEKGKGELYNLLTLHIISKFFYNSTRESVTISNSIITRLINILIDDDVKGKEICNIIESHTNYFQHSKRYHPYSRTYYSYSKTKTNDKAGKKRRTKKSRIKKSRIKKSRTKKNKY
jgi:hypothetical protein